MNSILFFTVKKLRSQILKGLIAIALFVGMLPQTAHSDELQIAYAADGVPDRSSTLHKRQGNESRKSYRHAYYGVLVSNLVGAAGLVAGGFGLYSENDALIYGGTGLVAAAVPAMGLSVKLMENSVNLVGQEIGTGWYWYFSGIALLGFAGYQHSQDDEIVPTIVPYASGMLCTLLAWRVFGLRASNVRRQFPEYQYSIGASLIPLKNSRPAPGLTLSANW